MDALGAGFGQLAGQGGRLCRWEGRFGVAGAWGRCCAGEDALYVGRNAIVVGGEALGRCHDGVLDEMFSCRWDLESDFTRGLSQTLRLPQGWALLSETRESALPESGYETSDVGVEVGGCVGATKSDAVGLCGNQSD